MILEAPPDIKKGSKFSDLPQRHDSVQTERSDTIRGSLSHAHLYCLSSGDKIQVSKAESRLLFPVNHSTATTSNISPPPQKKKKKKKEKEKKGKKNETTDIDYKEGI